MICRITGRLEEVYSDRIVVDCGAGLCYELMIASCDIEKMRSLAGKDVVLHTMHYIEGDPSHGAVVPRLVGFTNELDLEFFRVFTTVKGIGIRKGLRSLVIQMSQVAAAIEAKDPKILVALPEIGKKMAERIIIELSDKVSKFAGKLPGGAVRGEGEAPAEISQAGSEAVAVLVQLGEKRVDALALVERVLAVASELSTPEQIIQNVYKLKAGGV